MSKGIKLLEKLNMVHSLSLDEYEILISSQTDKLAEYAASLADKSRKKYYGNDIYIRGLIEISNICKNDCFYCGIRASNDKCDRYVLTKDEILTSCENGYALGFRTFVLQGGEGAKSIIEMCDIVRSIRKRYKDCAITLSIGECTRDEYKSLLCAGADRYLLRHETADEEHYKKLHPKELSFKNRMKCLYDLKELGFQVGCGFMVGSPFQDDKCLAKDLKFIEEFSPDMCGIGPFIPHKDTPLGRYKIGSAKKTAYLLSLIRLIKPNILLPATTALGTATQDGRLLGVQAGANVIMPNLSPNEVRGKYEIYENKLYTGMESAQNKEALNKQLNKIGFKIVTDRGDVKDGNL